ncbi:MAG: nucleoside-triphosphatase, partial [Anaerolineae bacterium]|nr:nucleoside-triphosphatase [Anaerolineae bacterium]
IDAQGRKIGIRLLRVETEEEQVLALAEGDLQGPRTGRYVFDADVMAWSLSGLRRALKGKYDLVLIDEIGPLELLRGEGLAPVLGDLRDLCEEPHVLIVVREALAEMLRERLDRPDLVTFSLGMDVRDTLAMVVAERYFPGMTAKVQCA